MNPTNHEQFEPNPSLPILEKGKQGKEKRKSVKARLPESLYQELKNRADFLYASKNQPDKKTASETARVPYLAARLLAKHSGQMLHWLRSPPENKDEERFFKAPAESGKKLESLHELSLNLRPEVFKDLVNFIQDPNETGGAKKIDKRKLNDLVVQILEWVIRTWKYQESSEGRTKAAGVINQLNRVGFR